MRFIAFCLLVVLVSIVVRDVAFARDLVEAASSAQSMFNRIGIAAISIGITVGGILFAMGAAMVGRMVMVSGIVGACAILGAPAIIALLSRIFGTTL